MYLLSSILKGITGHIHHTLAVHNRIQLMKIPTYTWPSGVNYINNAHIVSKSELRNKYCFFQMVPWKLGYSIVLRSAVCPYRKIQAQIKHRNISEWQPFLYSIDTILIFFKILKGTDFDTF